MHCGSAYKGARALNVSERSAIGKKANDEEEEKKKKNRISAQTTSDHKPNICGKSKHFVNEENRDYLFCHWVKNGGYDAEIECKVKKCVSCLRVRCTEWKSAVVLLMWKVSFFSHR